MTVMAGTAVFGAAARAQDQDTPPPAPVMETATAPMPMTIGGITLDATKKMKDLDGSWRRVTLGGPLDLGHWAQVIADYLGTPNPDFAYTNGQTVTLGTETYLVAYRPTFKGPGLMGMMMNAGAGQMPEPPKLTGETMLSLSLLNLRSTGSLDDIRTFDLKAEVAEYAKALENLDSFMSMMNAMKPDMSSPSHPAKPQTKKKKPLKSKKPVQ
jgi:hypothetical protein